MRAGGGGGGGGVSGVLVHFPTPYLSMERGTETPHFSSIFPRGKCAAKSIFKMNSKVIQRGGFIWP